MQMKFAHLFVTNEGRMTGYECAKEAGYSEDRARVTASELQSPKKYPLVVKYIGELRAEIQEKYGVNFERHITELARIRDEARIKGAWSAATNAEVARGKAAGLYVDQKLIMTGNIDKLSESEIESKMKQILDDHKSLIECVVIESNDEKNSLDKSQ